MDRIGNGIVCQSNKLIEARFNLTSNEQKLIIMMVALISLNDKDFKEYEIRVADFSDLLNIKNNNIYSEIKSLLLRLTSRTLFIKEKTGFLISSWVSSARYIEASGIVQLSFDKKLKPYLLELKSEFTKLNLFTVVQFRSSYTIRIYMLLKQYEKLKVREFDLLDFRHKLGMKDGIYREFRSFRERVINQAKKEFDEKDGIGNFISDITFIFEPIKQGRRIVRLRFLIVKNKHYKAPQIDKLSPVTESKQVKQHNKLKESDIFQTLRKLGIIKKKALEILDHYSEAIINEKLALTAEEERKNPSGFFLKALENDYKSAKAIKKEQYREIQQKEAEKRKQTEREDLARSLSSEFGSIERPKFLQSLTSEEMKNLVEDLKRDCEKDNNAYGLRLLEGGDVNDNFYVHGYINVKIPDFEKNRQRYIQKGLVERG